MAKESSTMVPPRLRFEIGSVVVPGDRIGTIRQVLPGTGTYNRGGHVYASLAGYLSVSPVESPKHKDAAEEDSATMTSNDDERDTTEQSPTFRCSIKTTVADDETKIFTNTPNAASQVIHVGQLVMGRVQRISTQSAIVQIKVAQSVGVLREGHYGSIRSEDIRANVNEVIPMDECFQPDDLVLARIVAMGDARRYFLTTAEPELGVIQALSAKSGQMMIPASWKQMECPDTGVREGRKVAKPSLMQQTVET